MVGFNAKIGFVKKILWENSITILLVFAITWRIA